MALHIDRADMLAAARVLMVLNPHIALRGFTTETLADFMESMAYSQLHDHAGYCGTYGFRLTSYARPGYPGDFVIMVSIMPSMVADYIVALAERAGKDAAMVCPPG